MLERLGDILWATASILIIITCLLLVYATVKGIWQSKRNINIHINDEAIKAARQLYKDITSEQEKDGSRTLPGSRK